MSIDDHDDPEEDRKFAQSLAPTDHRDTSDKKRTNVYCLRCGYNLKYLPPGKCPECGHRFHPEDLRTVSIAKPFIVNPYVSRAYALSKKLLMWAVVAFFIFAIIGAVFVFLQNIFG